MQIRILCAILYSSLCSLRAWAEPLPSGPDVVPPTSLAFISIRMSDVNTADSLKPAREAIARLEKTDASLEKRIGLPLNQIDRITLFWPSVAGGGMGPVPIVVVSTREPFNEAKLLKNLKALPPDEQVGRRRVRLAPGVSHEALKPTAKSAIAEPRHIGENPAIRPFPPKGPGPLPLGPAPGDPGVAPPPPKTKGPGDDGARLGDEPPVPKSVVSDSPAIPAGKDNPQSTTVDLFPIEREPYTTVFLLDDRTFVLLPSPEMDGGATMLSLVGQLMRRKGPGLLSDALTETSKHTFVAALRVDQLDAHLRSAGEFARDFVPFRSLFRARTLSVTADVGVQIQVDARLVFADETAARRAEPVVKTLLQLGTESLGDLRQEMAKNAEWSALMTPLIDLASGALDKAEVKTDGVVVGARMQAEVGDAVTKALAALPDLVELASTRQKTLNNLKQIGLAIHNYHDANGFMPADILDPTGKPLLSWRVQILPYLEQDNLYRRLDLTKSWDDPQNAEILKTMPDVFRVFGRDAKDKGQTFLQMPTALQRQAGGDPFQVRGQKTTFATITDGTSNTLMVVEASDPVSWAKPDDMRFDAAKAPKLGDPQRRDFCVLFGDGSVRTLRRDKLTDEQLKALITVNGGEIVNVPGQ